MFTVGRARRLSARFPTEEAETPVLSEKSRPVIEATAAVVSGTAVEDALADYGQTVAGIVGDENVAD